MDGLKRYVNDDRFRVDGDKNMRLLAFAFTIVFVWTGSKIVAVGSKEIIATSISSQISKGVSISYRLITYYLEFCQHRLRFISVYVNTKTSFQLLINKW